MDRFQQINPKVRVESVDKFLEKKVIHTIMDFCLHTVMEMNIAPFLIKPYNRGIKDTPICFCMI